MRRRDWPERFNEVIEANTRTHFDDGTWDCCIFAADCALAQTGVDPMPEFRGKYSDKEGAQRLIRAHPSKNLYGIMRSKFGNPHRTGGRGDIVYTITEDGPTLGVCIGATALFVARPEGFYEVSMSEIKKVFRAR